MFAFCSCLWSLLLLKCPSGRGEFFATPVPCGASEGGVPNPPFLPPLPRRGGCPPAPRMCGHDGERGRRWQNGPNEATRRNASDIRDALPATNGLGPPAVHNLRGYSAPIRIVFIVFHNCSLHCFPLFLRRRVLSRSFKALHCNWRQFSIADRLYFC